MGLTNPMRYYHQPASHRSRFMLDRAERLKWGALGAFLGAEWADKLTSQVILQSGGKRIGVSSKREVSLFSREPLM
jgi:hypothetical protein